MGVRSAPRSRGALVLIRWPKLGSGFRRGSLRAPPTTIPSLQRSTGVCRCVTPARDGGGARRARESPLPCPLVPPTAQAAASMHSQRWSHRTAIEHPQEGLHALSVVQVYTAQQRIQHPNS